MKTILYTSLFLGFSFFSKAQVGIGTQSPRGVLDVNGNTLVESYMVDTVNESAVGQYYIMVRSKDSAPVGKVKLLDVSLRNVGPVNKYKVTINNVNMDEILSLNTGLLKSKYVVAITDAVFLGANSQRNSNTTYGAFSTEITTVVRAGLDYNAINLDYKGATTQSSTNGNWEISLIVYEKELVKEWGTYNGSVVSGNTPAYSGTSTNTPSGLQ